MTSAFTHLNDSGAVHMVDVSAKDVTARVAKARGRFLTTSEVVGLLRDQALAKGDALAVARVAAIQGAKKTADLVPLCHPIGLHEVTVELTLSESDADPCVLIEVTTRTAERTGVEMEAMTAVVAAGLTLYDMTKAVDRSARLTDVELVSKSGGQSGTWERA